MDYSYVCSVLALPRPCKILRKSATSVEHAGAALSQYVMTESGATRLPAGRVLLTMAFDPVYKWLMTSSHQNRTDHSSFKVLPIRRGARKRCTQLRGGADSCDILFFQETHGRIEDRCRSGKCCVGEIRCFMPGCQRWWIDLSGTEKEYLPPDTEIGHHDLHPGRDKFIRIQHEAACLCGHQCSFPA